MFQGIHQPWKAQQIETSKCGKKTWKNIVFRVYSIKKDLNGFNKSEQFITVDIEIEFEDYSQNYLRAGTTCWGNVGASNQAPNLSLHRLKQIDCHLEGVIFTPSQQASQVAY